MSDAAENRPKASLTIGGQDVPLNHFVELALVGVIQGYLGAMRDIPPGEVVITIPAARREA
jgi:hypothetical protein